MTMWNNIASALIFGGSEGSGTLTEISTAEEMDALLIASNVGKAYKYTGTTTADYTNGDIYVVEEA